jgi:hypothetical protein
MHSFSGTTLTTWKFLLVVVSLGSVGQSVRRLRVTSCPLGCQQRVLSTKRYIGLRLALSSALSPTPTLATLTVTSVSSWHDLRWLHGVRPSQPTCGASSRRGARSCTPSGKSRSMLGLGRTWRVTRRISTQTGLPGTSAHTFVRKSALCRRFVHSTSKTGLLEAMVKSLVFAKGATALLGSCHWDRRSPHVHMDRGQDLRACLWFVDMEQRCSPMGSV